MRIAVSASIATDHLMTFGGKFSEQLVADQLENISLSFLVDELEMRRGGVACNISYALGRLGHRPILVGAVGADFAEYRAWLDRHGVDTSHVLVSSTRHTARFVCTTDRDQNQLASFYPGAMSEARDITLGAIAEQAGSLDLVLIGADDPQAMVLRSKECRERGIPFAADPSQQLAIMDGPEVRELIEGATYMFTNEYEAGLAQQKTGWSAEEILARVGTRITTLGGKGVRIERKGEPPLHVQPAVVRDQVDPTGVGDAFRGGFLSALAWGEPLERAAEVGNAVAVHALEVTGPQEYELDKESLLHRLSESYGPESASAVEGHL